MRKHYPICGCNGIWEDYDDVIDNDDDCMAWAYWIEVDRDCPRCEMYQWGDAYNDNMMRDLQEMNT